MSMTCVSVKRVVAFERRSITNRLELPPRCRLKITRWPSGEKRDTRPYQDFARLQPGQNCRHGREDDAGEHRTMSLEQRIDERRIDRRRQLLSIASLFLVEQLHAGRGPRTSYRQRSLTRRR